MAGADPAFAVGDRVLVTHTQYEGTFEAKVLKAEWRSEAAGQPAHWYYMLHYNGWNKKYDDWQPEGQISKIGPATAEMAVALKAKKQAHSKFGKRKAAGDFGMDAMAYMGGQFGQLGQTLSLELDMPVALKKALLDDYDAIVQDGKSVPLPRSPCIVELLKRYDAYMLSGLAGAGAQERAREEAEVQELSHGVRSYFDKCLSALLLYRTERPQCVAALSDGSTPSAVYGAEHLLRLMLKLPEIMPTAGMTPAQVAGLSAKLQDLLGWISSNTDSLLLSKDKYVEPEPLQ